MRAHGVKAVWHDGKAVLAVGHAFRLGVNARLELLCGEIQLLGADGGFVKTQLLIQGFSSVSGGEIQGKYRENRCYERKNGTDQRQCRPPRVTSVLEGIDEQKHEEEGDHPNEKFS